MSDSKQLQPVDSTPFQSRSTHNVQSWERIGSLAGGAVMVGKGLRRGGVFGLIQVAIGGVALARGITGHSSAKSLLEKGRQDMINLRSKVERAAEEMKNFKATADAAVRSAKVADDDSLQ